MLEGVLEFILASYEEFSWFFKLGYVVIISVLLSMLLVQLWKVTFLKKFLSTATSEEKDKVLSSAGTITSLLVYGIVYVGNEMIVQHTFHISIEWNLAWFTITSGAAVVWTSAKGIYTALHKYIQRKKSGVSSKDNKDLAKKDISQVKSAVEAESKDPKILNNPIGGKKLL